MSTPEGQPKVFISYSWGNAQTVERVNKLADFLEGNGVWIEMDRYQEHGSNLYRFMEQMVRDDSIDKVFCFCDASYQRKAESGEGGVGTEAAIITPKVYEQVKGKLEHARHRYIPIAMEVDADGQFTVPTMFQSLMLVTMTDPTKDHDTYLELLHIAAGKPKRVRNISGKLPTHLEPDTANQHQFGTEGKAILARMEARDQGSRRGIAALRDYLALLAEKLTTMQVEIQGNRLELLNSEVQSNLSLFQEFYEVVNTAAQFVETSIEHPLGEFFQQLALFNHSLNIERRQRDFTRIATIEFFVLSTAAFIDHRRFTELASLLSRPYWSREQNRPAENYFILAYPPEDLRDEKWLEQTRRLLAQSSTQEEKKYRQADAFLYFRGAFHHAYNWNMTLVRDWMAAGLPLLREINSKKTAFPLETILGMPLLQIVARLEEVENSNSYGNPDPLIFRSGFVGTSPYLFQLHHLQAALKKE